MGLFSKKKAEVSPEELTARETNRSKLSEFNVTKAWGVKKYEGAGAVQFIYDEDRKWFAVVPGPVSTFRDREPWVIDFDMVTDVILDVDENWSRDKNPYAPNGRGILTVDEYAKVYWRYDFYLTILTRYPFSQEIRYKMNFKATVTKVSSRNFMYRRGFEIGGTYRGSEIRELRKRMDDLIETEEKALKRGTVLDVFDADHPSSAGDAVREGITKAVQEDQYIKKLDNMRNHVKRAGRISKLLLSR